MGTSWSPLTLGSSPSATLSLPAVCPGIGGCAAAAVAVIPDTTGNGYWVVTKTGAVYGFGDAAYLGAPGLKPPVTSAVATPDGRGYYILDGSGEVFAYGDATWHGGASR